MTAQDEISVLFNGLNKVEQVEILIDLYNRMTDYQKDKFFIETQY